MLEVSANPANFVQSVPVQPRYRFTMIQTRRDILSTSVAFGLGAIAASASSAQTELPKQIGTAGAKKPEIPPQLKGYDEDKGQYILPPLPYKPDELEPHIDKATMELHHDKHHAGYVAGANKAMTELWQIRDGGDAALVKHWARELSFHLSGHVNHTLFWNMMAPPGKGGGGQPTGKLADAITRDFSSVDKFVAHFKSNAQQVDGSGWGWLIFDTVSKRLMLIQMEKQEDKFVPGSIPILGVDVWEHAYYLKHQNKRADYINAFMNVINWKFCEQLFEAAIK